jgi:hypothetical protein
MTNIEIVLGVVEELVNQGDIKEADAILRPYTKGYWSSPWFDRICDLETRIVDALILESQNKVVAATMEH